MDRLGIPFEHALHRYEARNDGFSDRSEDGGVVGASVLSCGDPCHRSHKKLTAEIARASLSPG